MKGKEDPIRQLLTEISDANDADIYLFSSEVNNESADMLIEQIRSRHPRRSNCILILTTNGGDPDAGYRIARMIKRVYSLFTLYIFGSCKSTGTLIALAADKILMGDFGEFGPLDIQLAKDDEMLHTSGLSYIQSLASLNEQIFHSFEKNFLEIKRRSGFTITTRTAAEIGTKLSIGLISPISGQLDPVKLGEVHRAMNIALAYGNRLCSNTERLNQLIGNYPSHGFVIDIEEAKTVFGNVIEYDDNAYILEDILKAYVRREHTTICDLTAQYVDSVDEEGNPNDEGDCDTHESLSSQDADLNEASERVDATSSEGQSHVNSTENNLDSKGVSVDLRGHSSFTSLKEGN